MVLLRLLLLCCLIIAPALAAGDSFVDLPHRSQRITLDGRLDDWKGPRLEIHLAEPELPAPLANTGTFYLVWDATHLWFAADITDAEVFPPGPDESGASLYQWDSVELYVDGRGDRSEHMDKDDFQLIVSCDGRHAVLQGEPLLHSIVGWQVTKREQPSIGVRAAARRTDTGYVVEAAFPLAAAGIAEAKAGQMLALDIAWNDWIEDHPRLPELQWTLDNLALLSGPQQDGKVAIVDPDSLGWDALLAWETRAYRPWSWSHGRDFGHPATWQLARLVGAPPLPERLARRWGVLPLLGTVFTLLLAAAVTADLWLHQRYRRRIGLLMARIEALSGQTTGSARPAPASPEPPAQPDPRPTFKSLDHSDLTTMLPDAPQNTATRLLDHAKANLVAPLSVAVAAAALGVSVRTLQRECRLALGASPRDVILAVKMRAAEDMLATGRWRVGEVAEQVGFDSPYHFSRRYKDFHGKPPSSAIPAQKIEPEPR
jgi:AraC-like DNA-binding protein